MKSHPLDSPGFREWYKEQDEEYMEFGIYDSRWAELFDQYLEETQTHERTETTTRSADDAPTST